MVKENFAARVWVSGWVSDWCIVLGDIKNIQSRYIDTLSQYHDILTCAFWNQSTQINWFPWQLNLVIFA